MRICMIRFTPPPPTAHLVLCNRDHRMHGRGLHARTRVCRTPTASIIGVNRNACRERELRASRERLKSRAREAERERERAKPMVERADGTRKRPRTQKRLQNGAFSAKHSCACFGTICIAASITSPIYLNDSLRFKPTWTSRVFSPR